MGSGEEIVRREEMIKREELRYGERIREYVYDVRREKSGKKILMQRKNKKLMEKILKMEVKEIYEGIIEIKQVDRDKG